MQIIVESKHGGKYTTNILWENKNHLLHLVIIINIFLSLPLSHLTSHIYLIKSLMVKMFNLPKI